MNHALQLSYTHADHTGMLRDARKERPPEVACNHIYYVGFRISAGNDEHYRHALILADDYDTFLDGIAGEYNAILEHPSVTSTKDIALVFVRNLLMLDPEMSDSADCQNITTEIRAELSRQGDNQYLVFGTVGEHKICLMQANSCDALMAIHRARTASMDQFKAEFMPLEVCQAHPVTAECYALFDAAAERIMSLDRDVSAGTGYLH